MTCAFSCSPFDTSLLFVSQLCRVTIMTRFLDLPFHVHEAVCAHACLPIEPGRPQRGSLALTETCWEVNTIAAPIVWRTLRLRSHHMVLKEGSLQSLLAAATRIGASRSHPARLAKKLIIDRKIAPPSIKASPTTSSAGWKIVSSHGWIICLSLLKSQQISGTSTMCR